MSNLLKTEINNIEISGKLNRTVDRAIYKAKKANRVKRNSLKVSLVAVIILASLTIANFSAIADAFNRFFAAPDINNSAHNAVENDYYVNSAPSETENPNADDTNEIFVSKNGEMTLSLEHYYIEKNEIGIDYILTGINLDEYNGFDILDRRLEMVNNENNEILVWEEKYNDKEHSRMFPGGYYKSANDFSEHEYQAGNEGQSNIYFEKLSENTYSVVDIIKFDYPIEIGDTVNINYNMFRFTKEFTESLKEENPSVYHDFLDVDFAFSFNIDEKFKNNSDVVYRVTNADELIQKGIEVESIVAMPLTTRLELKVDFSKSKIANEENIVIADNNLSFKAKIDCMDLSGAFDFEIDGRKINWTSGGRNVDDTEVIRTTENFESIYFLRPDTFIININETDGNIINMHFEKVS